MSFDDEDLKHFSHEHDLGIAYLHYSPRFCNMCSRLIPKGLHCYCCTLCRYFVHEECAALPEHFHHSLHPSHGLKLTKRSSNGRCLCYYCEKPFENEEYAYACSQLCSDFYMHMACAMIPLPTITAMEDQGVVQFACHQQPMTLVEHLDGSKRGAKCFGCQSNGSGPAYSCISEECENFLHKPCAELPQKIQHPFHSPHSLILQVSKPQSCRSCCKKACRLIFNCHEDGCNFALGIECFSLDIMVKCRSHDHSLSLVEKSSCKFQCDACQMSYENGVNVIPKEVNHTSSFIFRCMKCVFNIHFLCGPLPSIIIYEHHMHPLVLSNHSVSEDDSNNYYCDVCEEERNQSFRIYYCEECKYVAHIHCLIYEIMTAIKGETKDVELKVLGEDRWNLVDIESMDHQSKEKSSESTLKEILGMLTEQEKEMLIDPFAFNNPSSKVYRINSYNQYRRYNSRFDRDGTIEDIDRVEKFFLFHRPNVSFFSEDMDDLKIFHSELRYFTPEDGLLKLLENKYLRQKVEDVDDYMVPETLAPVLRTLVIKFKTDIVSNANLTPAMKSITSTLLCIVIDKICRTKVEDITKDDLRRLYFYLTGIQEITGFTLARYLDSFADIVKAFLGFEAIRYEKVIREKLEAEIEKCKGNLERLNIYKSHMSDFMKECTNKALEWKQMRWGDMWF